MRFRLWKQLAGDTIIESALAPQSGPWHAHSEAFFSGGSWDHRRGDPDTPMRPVVLLRLRLALGSIFHGLQRAGQECANAPLSLVCLSNGGRDERWHQLFIHPPGHVEMPGIARERWYQYALPVRDRHHRLRWGADAGRLVHRPRHSSPFIPWIGIVLRHDSPCGFRSVDSTGLAWR